ncbi:MAG: ankyrin repeat domain-containing protein [Hyphomicrobiaceae bacterium]|nr:MAG: ankyrin repeat domain-containing protein [Hyphomicrobiaceae bacterium]
MKAYRYYVRSPDGRAIFGFDRLEAAVGVALEYGAGAALVDTMAQAYHPMVQEMRPRADGSKELFYLPIGGWDTGRFGADRDMIEGIKKGHPAIVHAFLAKGASANAVDTKGGPALHWAAARGNAEVVKLLLAHGADINARDGKGQTALDVAVAKNKTAIRDLLKAAGAG